MIIRRNGKVKTVEKQERYVFMDLLRALSFLVVIMYHFRFEITASGMYRLPLFVTELLDRLDLSGIAVAVFFMLSGAGLCLETREGLELKAYYKKRFKSVLVPFYIAYIICFAFLFLRHKTAPIVIKGFSDLYKIPAILFGADGYLTLTFGLSNLYLGVGEWFLGELVIMYLFFPLIRKGIKKQPHLFMIISTGIYISLLVICIYKGNYLSFLPFKTFNFITGAYFITVLTEGERKSGLCIVPVGAIYLLSLLFRSELTNQESRIIIESGTTFFAMMVFYFMYYTENQLEASLFLKKPLKFFNRFSYCMYLVHHVTIAQLIGYFAGFTFGLNNMLSFMVSGFVVIIAFSIAVRLLSEAITKEEPGKKSKVSYINVHSAKKSG